MEPNPSIRARLEDVDRLAALAETGLLDAEAMESLDRYVRLVNRAVGAPVALVSLIDDHRQFMSSLIGVPEPFATSREMPLTHSLCKHVVAEEGPLVVSDLRNHPELHGHPAISDHGVIAYAGMPIRTDDGRVLGSFCAIDDKPREWSERDVAILEDLAAGVNEEMNLRRRATRAERSERLLAAASARLSALSDADSKHALAVLHDIRTPLSVLSLGVSTLSAHALTREHPELAHLLEVLNRNVAHARSLASAMMSHAGSESAPHRASTDAVAVAQQVCEDLEPAEGLRLTLRSSVPHLELAIADSELRRCVENLVTNALRFAAEQVIVSVEAREGRARIVVEDDGPGLSSPGQYDAAWDASTRFHDASGQSGTGLGLAVVREIVKRQGGSVFGGDSEMGGARFELELPSPPPAS